eukprot:4791062-Pyramimonas_sp.AAC.1
MLGPPNPLLTPILTPILTPLLPPPPLQGRWVGAASIDAGPERAVRGVRARDLGRGCLPRPPHRLDRGQLSDHSAHSRRRGYLAPRYHRGARPRHGAHRRAGV